MAGLLALNGLAQATGWSGNIGTMAGWFHRHERGRVMGAWATNFNIGSLVAGWTMAGVLGAMSPAPWRWCFFAGAAFLTGVWVLYYFFQRNTPEDVGLAPIDDPVTPVDEAEVPDPIPEHAFLGLDRNQWTNLMLVGGFYFFIKFIRYAIWSWAPYFLETNYQLTSSTANWYATAFDFLGLPSVFLCGYLSDVYFKSRRGEISLIFMIGVTLATAAMYALYGTGVLAYTVILALIGFSAYGPDALLTGAGAMDIGGRRSATFAAAVISGLGSLGSIVQELVIARVYDPKTGDLNVVFMLLLGSAAMATLFCALLVLRNRRGGKGV
jgi:OPA family sugar phosphate sensor protein UhpC-like MFS transporter